MTTRSIFLAVSLLALAGDALAQCSGERLRGQFAPGGDVFGFDVALSGDTLVAGAPLTGGGLFAPGGAYVFEPIEGAWTSTQFLVAATTTTGDNFGTAVDIDGDRLVISAAYAVAGNGSGVVYVFERSGGVWSEVEQLVASDADTGGGLGSALDLEGDRLVVGAAGDAQGAGAAYVFERTAMGWAEVAKLVASDSAAGASFGSAVALDGDRIAVGAPERNGYISRSGAAYVFERSGGAWIETALLAPAGAVVDEFVGRSVALQGDTLVLGAPGAGPILDAGAAYVYRATSSNWSLAQRLSARAPVQSGHFGRSAGLDGEWLMIGAPTNLAEDAAHIFRAAGASWHELGAITESGLGASSNFGFAVCVEDGRALVTAPFHSQTGSVFVYEDLESCSSYPLDPERYCDPAAPNSTGAAGRIDAAGHVDPLLGDLTLTASQLPSGQFGYFLTSRTQGANTPMGSSGVLCLFGNIGRFNLPMQIIAGPTGSLDVDLTLIPVNPTAPVQPGETWNFQCWYRDSGTSNFTDAVSVAFL